MIQDGCRVMCRVVVGDAGLGIVTPRMEHLEL